MRRFSLGRFAGPVVFPQNPPWSLEATSAPQPQPSKILINWSSVGRGRGYFLISLGDSYYTVEGEQICSLPDCSSLLWVLASPLGFHFQ